MTHKEAIRQKLIKRAQAKALSGKLTAEESRRMMIARIRTLIHERNNTSNETSTLKPLGHLVS